MNGVGTSAPGTSVLDWVGFGFDGDDPFALLPLSGGKLRHLGCSSVSPFPAMVESPVLRLR